MTELILKLMSDYLECAQKVTQELRQQSGVQNLLLAAHTKQIPAKGTIRKFGDARYTFHGKGCRVEYSDFEIDFDFGPDGTVPGIDPWKLFNFGQSNRTKYTWLPTRPEFDLNIRSLKQNGILSEIGEDPSPHLLVLKDRFQT